MKSYTIETYRKYINGDDPGFPLEELESDPSFMKVILDVSNDPKMVKMCSKELLLDYEFLKFIIYKFKDRDDLFKNRQAKDDFICEIADYFLNNSTECDDVFDLAVRMLNIIKDDTNLYYYLFTSMCLQSYQNMMNSIGKYKKENNNERIDVGMGFYFIDEEYEDYEQIKRFFAKIFISEIFNKDNVNIEADLHKRFKNKEKASEIKIYDYLLNHIQKYDLPLKGFLVQRLDLLNDSVEEVKTCLKRWDYYETNIEEKKYEKIFDDVHKYMDECADNSVLCEMEILYFVAKVLGIEDEVAKHDCVSNFITEELKDTINEEYIVHVLITNVCDYANYQCVLSIVKDIISCDNIDELYKEEDLTLGPISYSKHRVIKCDFKNKKVVDNRG